MVSVLVSFTSVRRRSQHRSAPTSTPERTTLDAPERSCSDLESVLGSRPRGFESRILRQLETHSDLRKRCSGQGVPGRRRIKHRGG